MARTSKALKVVSGMLYVIAIVSGFASVYPIYTVYQPFQNTSDTGSPLTNLLAAVVLLGISALAYLAQVRLNRYIDTTPKS